MGLSIPSPIDVSKTCSSANRALSSICSGLRGGQQFILLRIIFGEDFSVFQTVTCETDGANSSRSRLVPLVEFEVSLKIALVSLRESDFGRPERFLVP